MSQNRHLPALLISISQFYPHYLYETHLNCQVLKPGLFLCVFMKVLYPEQDFLKHLLSKRKNPYNEHVPQKERNGK